ncbi:MAG: glycosyltransferase family 39 protein [Gemmatimonadetes bacterium]|nr:glycosyltransferase family 39 protein [Gemmatimonadota bacterium]
MGSTVEAERGTGGPSGAPDEVPAGARTHRVNRIAPAFWFALAVAGQAMALRLVRAGFMVGYQHYVPADEVFAAGHSPELLFLLAQLIAVGIGIRAHVPAVLRWVRSALPGWRLPVVALVFVVSGATLSRAPSLYIGELALASMVQALALATVFLMAASLPAGAGRAIERWLSSAAPDRPDRFAILAAVWVTVLCALLAVFAYQRHPHVPDEVIYLLHARYFAAGMLELPLPPIPDAFNLDLMTYEATRWYSPVPPGWPAVLAVGAFFGVPWLVNPVLNGINVLLASRLLRDVCDARTARLGALLLACSPWFLFMGMNFMTHTLTMTAALAGAVGAARLRSIERVSPAAIMLAGAGIGMLGLIRPFEGLTIAALLAGWVLASPVRRGLVARAIPVAAMGVVAVATSLVQLPYNQYMAGDPLTFPLMAYTDSVYGVGTNALGFGADRGLGWPGLDPLPGHGVADIFVNGNLNVFQVNIELLGWSIGSVLPIALLLGLGRLRRQDVWMLVVIAAIVGVHSFYWFSGGPDFGARYWYLILLPCIALVARAIAELAERIGPPAAGRVHAAALALCAAMLFTFLPWRAADKYHHYRNMRPDVRRLAAENDFGESLVLVRGNRHPDYASAAAYNPLDLRAPVPIYAWDRSADVRERVLEAYADRPVWVLDGPTRTGDGFRVARGPVPAAELLIELRAGR